MSRPKILVALGCFWPGNDASGPNQSFIALATALSETYDFHVVARDRAPGAPQSAASSPSVNLGYARAHYLPPGLAGLRLFLKMLRSMRYDLLWLNSVYDRELTLPALLAHILRVTRAPILLSPRGEFAPGALQIKALKKRIFLPFLRVFASKNVVFHATNEQESLDIAHFMPNAQAIIIAPNVRMLLPQPVFIPSKTLELRVIFVGRIVPIKGLNIALQALSGLQTPVSFDIFGPPEDEAVYAQARIQAQNLPASIRVYWHGTASNTKIIQALARSDLFLLPTGGENFGHAIFEALCCGVPVLISNRTPWRDLSAKQAGWDLPLEDVPLFTQKLADFAAMPEEERTKWRAGARATAQVYVETSDALRATTKMIERVLRGWT